MAAITWSGPIYKCTNSKEPVLENICGSKIFLIVLWQYDPDITLYLNANYSKWWQPQVKTERGLPPPLRTTDPPLVIPDSCPPRVSVCNIGHQHLFPHKITQRKIPQWWYPLSGGPHHLLTDQCFCQFLPILLPIEERLGRRNTGTYRRPETL